MKIKDSIIAFHIKLTPSPKKAGMAESTADKTELKAKGISRNKKKTKYIHMAEYFS